MAKTPLNYEFSLKIYLAALRWTLSSLEIPIVVCDDQAVAEYSIIGQTNKL